MKKRNVRISLLALLLTIGIAGYFIGRSFIFSRLEKAIVAQMDSLRQKGALVRYRSLETNSWEKSLVIEGLEVKFNHSDSLCFTSGTIAKFEVRGISLLPLLLRHELDLDAIFMDHPVVRAMNNFKVPGWREEKVKSKFLKGIQVGFLKIDSGDVQIIDSASCGNFIRLRLNANSRNLSAHLINDDSSTWAIREITIAAVKADLPTYFYNLTVKQATYNGNEKVFIVDSLQLTPTYNRVEFARKAGGQIDQFSGSIPLMRATGFEIGKSFPSFAAHHVDLRFRLEAFRDKRIPRKKRKPSVLPVSFLKQLSFRLQIDSLTLTDSYASYEEFPETGDAPGKIFFNGLHGGISNISNRSFQGATMNVSSRFMNAGDLTARFTFPVEEQGPYAVRGSLSNFSLPGINTMLVPVANVEIESGKMQSMKFQFQYNAYRSDGNVELSYTDLKVRSIKKNPEKSENKLVSFIINMFVKDDLDKTDTKAKRTGSIEFYRNDQRGILNYWWKSVFSGVKSVYQRKNNGQAKKGKQKTNS